ncbi:hypothetical protein DL98DRAFT_471323 [Cadophora sp. DSE1049]|nr:hypothetical protein DL98DRAFT_471323 [Cadophora sp. DSE1049]
MALLSLSPVNHVGTPDHLTVTASRGTDIVPESSHVPPFQFSSAISKISLPSHQFVRARVTITWPQAATVQWDQAGILFLRPHRDLPKPSKNNPGDERTTPSFAKVGLEQFQRNTFYSVSASNGGPPEGSVTQLEADFPQTRKATVEIVKYGSQLAAIAVYRTREEVEKQVFRVVPWCFAKVEEDGPDVWIGLYVCRPDHESETTDGLTVQFCDFELETVDGGVITFP